MSGEKKIIGYRIKDKDGDYALSRYSLICSGALCDAYLFSSKESAKDVLASFYAYEADENHKCKPRIVRVVRKKRAA